ncbi:hypothetical protein K402DRAFT_357556 [Aulographum hederae CBS 113979]|uniref:Acyltransferase 3 domain-containing protein n=1 Tax=Aulographum hederae CBS 113979 TaxID=1176131 RepID=A0A6G1GX16_9PEZI|nr:hypothetical protein K402DRAFT_357556 [Aulographum hederae CBS 113979]
MTVLRFAWPSSDSKTNDTRWADGLRGVAAVGVLCSHLTLSFFLFLVSPCETHGEGEAKVCEPLLFQRPILRIFNTGNAWVALFMILMGFVNSLKTMKQAQSGDLTPAVTGLARTSFARIPRLVLPGTTVTIIAWFLCQLGFFEVARQSSAWWLSHNSRAPSANWYSAVGDLVQALVETWVEAENPYDQPQWALVYLMKGSLFTFLILLLTSTTRPSYRRLIIAIAYLWSWSTHDGLVGTNVFFGMFLADLHVTSTLPTFRTPSLRLLPLLTAFLALWLMSYPSSDEYADADVPWIRALTHIFRSMTPNPSEMSRYIPGVGAQLLCLSIHVSQDLKALFSIRVFTWLGSVSLSMYLLHGPLMRSVLAWMAFGPAYLLGVRNSEGKIPAPSGFALTIILLSWFGLLLVIVHIWTKRIEPLFARATKFLVGEAKVTPEQGKEGTLPQ